MYYENVLIGLDNFDDVVALDGVYYLIKLFTPAIVEGRSAK